MATLGKKLQVYLGRELRWLHSDSDVYLNWDNNNNLFIEKWDVDEAQPTQEQLDALDDEANTLVENENIISTRRGLYGSPVKQFEFIVENGIDAFISKQEKIKTDNPKV